MFTLEGLGLGSLLPISVQERNQSSSPYPSLSLTIMAYLHCRTETRIVIRVSIFVQNGHSSNWGSRSGSKSESASVQWDQFLYSTVQPSGLELKSELVTKSMSGNVNKP